MMTLEYAESYLHDRVKELRNQLPFGDPFVFLGAFTIVNTLKNATGDLTFKFMPRKYHNSSYVRFDTALQEMADHYSLPPGMAICHINEKHLTFEGSKVVLAAEPLLNDVDIAITQVFSDAKTDPLLAAKLLVNLNKNRFIG